MIQHILFCDSLVLLCSAGQTAPLPGGKRTPRSLGFELLDVFKVGFDGYHQRRAGHHRCARSVGVVYLHAKAFGAKCGCVLLLFEPSHTLGRFLP